MASNGSISALPREFRETYWCGVLNIITANPQAANNLSRKPVDNVHKFVHN